jgi:hypothetical protein
VIRYSDRVKGHPFRFNLSQRLRDGVLNAFAFIGSLGWRLIAHQNK